MRKPEGHDAILKGNAKRNIIKKNIKEGKNVFGRICWVAILLREGLSSRASFVVGSEAALLERKAL